MIGVEASYDFQTWWLAIILLSGATVNVWNFWRWHKNHGVISIAVRIMTVLRACISSVVGTCYLLDGLDIVSQTQRQTLFLAILAPIYWPMMIWTPAFLLSPGMLEKEKADITEKLATATVEAARKLAE